MKFLLGLLVASLACGKSAAPGTSSPASVSLAPLEGRPPGYDGLKMVYFPPRERFVAFGGTFTPVKGQFVATGETWELDGSAWTRLEARGPSPRGSHGMAYDAVRQVIVLFGGIGECGDDKSKLACCRDTWEWDGSVWREIAVPDAPSARYDGTMSFEPSTGRVLLLGGHACETRAPVRDLWSFDGQRWNSEWPGPGEQ